MQVLKTQDNILFKFWPDPIKPEDDIYKKLEKDYLLETLYSQIEIRLALTQN